MTQSEIDKSEEELILNCKETLMICACMRNRCDECGGPVGNITFTVCDKCWDKLHPKKVNPDTTMKPDFQNLQKEAFEKDKIDQWWMPTTKAAVQYGMEYVWNLRDKEIAKLKAEIERLKATS